MSADAEFALPGGYELRALEPRDATELHELIEHNRERLAHWIQWAAAQTPADTAAFIERARAKEREGSGLSRGIVGAGRLVGVVGISLDQANRSASIGYWIDEAHAGRGVVSAAVAALVEHGFERWGLHRVEISADVLNTASCAVAERLGFQREGILRQAYRVSDERYSDDAVYSMLASDPARAALSSWAREPIARR